MFFVIPTDAVFLKEHLKYGQMWHQKEKKQKLVNCQNISRVKRNH